LAICHGIQALIAVGLVSGKRVTCYEQVCAEVDQSRGTYTTEQAVLDGRLVTGQTWQSHAEFYREVFGLVQRNRPRLRRQCFDLTTSGQETQVYGVKPWLPVRTGPPVRLNLADSQNLQFRLTMESVTKVCN